MFDGFRLSNSSERQGYGDVPMSRWLPQSERCSGCTQGPRLASTGLENMSTASCVAAGSFFRQHSAGQSVETDHLAGWSTRSTVEFVENSLLRRNHGATGGLDGRGGR